MSSDDAINNQSSYTAKNRIYDFLATGFKKSMSPNVKNSYVVKHVKERTFDIYSCMRDVLYILLTSADILFRCLLMLLKITKNFPDAFKKAAKNNFKLGLESLKINNLIEARIRFLLSNMFYNKSAATKYYIAYTYYLQKNFSKSLKYLEQSIKIDSKNKKSIELFKNIENEMKNTSI